MRSLKLKNQLFDPKKVSSHAASKCKRDGRQRQSVGRKFVFGKNFGHGVLALGFKREFNIILFSHDFLKSISPLLPLFHLKFNALSNDPIGGRW